MDFSKCNCPPKSFDLCQEGDIQFAVEMECVHL